MKYLKVFVFAFILCNLMSCTKEDDKIEMEVEENTGCTDPQSPGEYFPAYPTSWWNYYDNNDELVEFKISSEYQECEGACRPVFENIDKCIQGDAFIQPFYAGLGTSSTMRSRIYSTTLDSVLICPISFSTFKEQDSFLDLNDVRYLRKAITMDTSIVVNDKTYENVLVMYEYDRFKTSHQYYDYFAKNIGLIKRDSVNPNDTTDLIEILRLNSYSIGD